MGFFFFLKELETSDERVTSLSRKFNELEEQVKRFQEREKHLHDVRMLEAGIPWKEMLLAVEEYKTSKSRKALKRSHIDNLNVVINSLSQKEIELSNMIQTSANNDRSSSLLVADEKRDIPSLFKNVDNITTKEKNFREDILHHKKQLEIEKKEIDQLRNDIRKLEVDIERASNEDFQDDLEDIKRKLLLVGNDISNLSSEIEMIKREKYEIMGDLKRQNDKLTHMEKALHELDSVDSQKLNVIKSQSIEAYKVIQALRSGNHGLQFEKEIFNPICLNITPKGTLYGSMLENITGISNLMVIQKTSFKNIIYFYNSSQLELCSSNQKRLLHSFEFCFRQIKS